MKLSIVIPAHNEAGTIGQALQGVIELDLSGLRPAEAGFGHAEAGVRKEIIVVDDGSSDRTAAIARTIAGSGGVVLVTHLIQRGLGGALGTGIEAALRGGADLVVTFDADGQHAPEDIPLVIRPILMNQADVVIGSRMLGGEGMPWHRQIANHLANLFTWLLFWVRTTDSQSGLRAFSRFAAERIRITSNNYEVSSEICGEIGRQRLRLTEVPIRPIYTDYSLSKGQGFLTGIRTLLRMLLHLTER